MYLGFGSNMRTKKNIIMISHDFHLVVSGSADGVLLFIVDETGGLTCGCVREPEGAISKRILIPPEWGFALVAIETAKEQFIAVYTVNGEKIRSARIGANVAAWTVWRSNSGFDFAVLADDKGAVFVFEVFWLKLGKPILIIREPVRAVFVAPKDEIMAIIGTDKLYIQSFPELD